MIFIAYIFLSIYLVNYSYNLAKSNYDYKVSVSHDFKNENFETLQKDLQKIILMTFLGGIIAGMLGIGGGMITTPLLLGIGVDAKSATSTSNLLIIFTALTGTLIFIFSVKFQFTNYLINLKFSFYILGSTLLRLRYMSCNPMWTSCSIR
jgi:succinate dehydrogenase/fumarate reductase cytochrome b subunit